MRSFVSRLKRLEQWAFNVEVPVAPVRPSYAPPTCSPEQVRVTIQALEAGTLELTDWPQRPGFCGGYQVAPPVPFPTNCWQQSPYVEGSTVVKVLSYVYVQYSEWDGHTYHKRWADGAPATAEDVITVLTSWLASDATPAA